MTTVYLFPVGQGEISRRGREPGWRKKRDGSPLSLDRAGYRETRALAAQLRGKGATRIYCADLYASTAAIVKAILDVPIEIDERLRPFNLGSHTCRSNAAVNDIFTRLVREWQAKPEIPMKGGDSLISFRNRFLKAAEPILNSGGTVVLVLDLRSARFLRSRLPESLPEDGSLRGDRIYILRREAPNANPDQPGPSVDSGPERSVAGPVHARVPEVGAGVSQPAYR